MLELGRVREKKRKQEYLTLIIQCPVQINLSLGKHKLSCHKSPCDGHINSESDFCLAVHAASPVLAGRRER